MVIAVPTVLPGPVKYSIRLAVIPPRWQFHLTALHLKVYSDAGLITTVLPAANAAEFPCHLHEWKFQGMIKLILLQEHILHKSYAWTVHNARDHKFCHFRKESEV